MTKPKTLDQLRAEKERAETQLAQEQHKLERLENRKKYLEKGERTKRTHRLCNLGGTVESLAPEIKDLTRTEMTELMAKNKTEIHVTTVFDGELDATDVFVSLISQKYGKTNTKEYLAKRKDMSYNEDEVQKSQIPSGLCG